MIGKRGFRQLLFEYPNASLAVLNYYLTEEKFKNIDTLNLLTAEARAGSVTDRSFFELMQWLKQFNLTHPKDMVQLKGFDISGAGRSFVNYFRSNFNTLLDSITKLNVARSMREMSSIDHAEQLIIEWFYKNQDTVQRRLKKYYPDLLYNVRNAAWALQHTERQKVNFYGASAFRDSIMAVNINELASSTKTIVWTHNLHVTTADNVVSMGNYLKKLRSDSYTIITDFTRSGKVYVATKSNELAVKSVVPSKETASYKLADKYKLPAGVVFYNDLIPVKKIGVLFNSIDKFGNNIILGKGHGFDAMILLDLLTAAEPFLLDIQGPVTEK
ncbi:MAG: erythromycin esterase family protein [Niabella sp.]|nr:erythromycin esterase family protein [Niabella sp.]